MRGPPCPRMFFGVEVNNEQNINAWLSGASQEVVETTSRLMGAVEELRKTETIYPAPVSYTHLTLPTTERV
mgnify:CR=1 FL=1